MFERIASRRRFITGIAGGAAALSLRPLASAAGVSRPAPSSAVQPRVAWGGSLPERHLAWVWQFDQDGEPERIRAVLAEHGLGVALKTHDGVNWMAKWDRSGNAVSGDWRVGQLAEFFEAGGVPFHAWCVVKGVDASKEASMAAAVLRAGARSLSIDLESYPGFWTGTQFTALQYTGELRQAQPDATVMVSMDARPWEVDRIPIREFAAAANALAPQVYWSDFGTPPNITKYRQAGVDPGPGGVTPRFALDVAARKLASLNLPIHPIGPGLVTDHQPWAQFIGESYARDVDALSVWRFGTTTPRVWEMLAANPPQPRTHTVRPGDTLGVLARSWGTSVEEIVRTNGLANPNMVVVGQQLSIPRVVVVPESLRNAPPAAPAAPPAPRTYVVQPGDSIGALAVRWGTTSARIAQVNGLADANHIRIGQTLLIP